MNQKIEEGTTYINKHTLSILHILLADYQILFDPTADPNWDEFETKRYVLSTFYKLQREKDLDKQSKNSSGLRIIFDQK